MGVTPRAYDAMRRPHRGEGRPAPPRKDSVCVQQGRISRIGPRQRGVSPHSVPRQIRRFFSRAERRSPLVARRTRVGTSSE